MSAQFNVVLSGTVVDGHDLDSVIGSLAARFKLEMARAAGLLKGQPSVVKKGVDRATAEQLCAAIIQLGAQATVQPAAASAVASVPAASAPQPQQAPAAVASTPPATTAKVLVPDPRGMKFNVQGQPDYAFLTVQIPANQTLKVEASAMATMDTNLVMKTRLRGGLGRFVTGESIFINEFTAQGGPGEIGIAPGAPGDLRHVYLQDQTIYLQNSAYVASSSGVTVESKWQGLMKGFFSGESLFLIRCQGQGDLWFSSYGGIIEIDVSGEYVVDTGNIVAFTDGLQYNVTKVGGYKSLFFSGEGFVCRFSGQGRVWIQTRKVGPLVSWVWPFRPTKK
ncbi:MAG TPA: TIGR00266 family protein [Steroidobacter sp.]|uniref:TIGR00266 family protein n=1 Tax=Steroidobacter sp. TaxID=1978227 RepID=UPI002ED8731F